MGKIGRNQSCLCGSGKKYKHCCLLKRYDEASASPAPSNTPQQQIKTSLRAAIEQMQRKAAGKEVAFQELGVFLFFSDEAGDAWMLECTECDALKIAEGGKALEASVEENEETIAVNFSHTFELRNRELFLSAYEDKMEFHLTSAPSMQIHAAMRRLRKHYSKEVLDKLHLQGDEAGKASQA